MAGTTMYDLLVQKIDSEGNLCWNEGHLGVRVSLIDPPTQCFYSDLLTDDDGGVYIRYSIANYRAEGRFYWWEYDAYIQHIDRDGNRVWGVLGIPLSADSTVNESGGDLLYTGDGNIFTTWGIRYNDNDERKYAQVISPDGELIWEEDGRQVHNDRTSHMFHDQDDGFYLINTHHIRPRSQRIDAEGDLLWGEDGILVEGRVKSPIVDTEHNIVFFDGTLLNDVLTLRKMNSDGEQIWEEGILLDEDRRLTRFAELSCYQEDRYFVLYAEDLDEEREVFAQLLNSDGDPLWGEEEITLIDSDLSTRYESPLIVIEEHIYVLALSTTGDNEEIETFRLLKFDAEGNRLFGENGMELFPREPTTNSCDFMVDGSNGLIVHRLDGARLYLWRIRQDGTFGASPDHVINDGIDAIVNDFNIVATFPNPFNSNISVKFNVRVPSVITTDILTVQGQTVYSTPTKYFKTGYNNITINSEGLASGNYFIRMETRDQMITQRMVIIR